MALKTGDLIAPKVWRNNIITDAIYVSSVFLLQCLDTLVQFGGFLSTHLSAEEYSRRVPKIDDLGLVYHIPADISFFVLRPIIRNSISVSNQAGKLMLCRDILLTCCFFPFFCACLQTKFVELEKACMKSESEKQDKKATKGSKQQEVRALTIGYDFSK